MAQKKPGASKWNARSRACPDDLMDHRGLAQLMFLLVDPDGVALSLFLTLCQLDWQAKPGTFCWTKVKRVVVVIARRCHAFAWKVRIGHKKRPGGCLMQPLGLFARAFNPVQLEPAASDWLTSDRGVQASHSLLRHYSRPNMRRRQVVRVRFSKIPRSPRVPVPALV